MFFYFIDTRLPFGCRTSPAIFNSFADALSWILLSCGGILHLVHYFTAIFMDIGLPISLEKTLGPSSQITYLGVEIDTVAWCIWFPQEKFTSLMLLLDEWEGKGNVQNGNCCPLPVSFPLLPKWLNQVDSFFACSSTCPLLLTGSTTTSLWISKRRQTFLGG